MDIENRGKDGYGKLIIQSPSDYFDAYALARRRGIEEQFTAELAYNDVTNQTNGSNHTLSPEVSRGIIECALAVRESPDIEGFLKRDAVSLLGAVGLGEADMKPPPNLDILSDESATAGRRTDTQHLPKKRFPLTLGVQRVRERAAGLSLNSNIS